MSGSLLLRRPTEKLRFPHIGWTVDPIDSALAYYRSNLSNISQIVQVISESVAVCCGEIGPGIVIELIGPLNTESAI